MRTYHRVAKMGWSDADRHVEVVNEGRGRQWLPVGEDRRSSARRGSSMKVISVDVGMLGIADDESHRGQWQSGPWRDGPRNAIMCAAMSRNALLRPVTTFPKPPTLSETLAGRISEKRHGGRRQRSLTFNPSASGGNITPPRCSGGDLAVYSIGTRVGLSATLTGSPRAWELGNLFLVFLGVLPSFYGVFQC
ncbi:hypothetical protein U1Q18_043899 [Sarracenia purpurea var. burkii]